jgi:hypothetical protein
VPVKTGSGNGDILGQANLFRKIDDKKIRSSDPVEKAECTGEPGHQCYRESDSGKFRDGEGVSREHDTLILPSLKYPSPGMLRS